MRDRFASISWVLLWVLFVVAPSWAHEEEGSDESPAETDEEPAEEWQVCDTSL